MHRALLTVWLSALPLCASTITVSSERTVTLSPGDALAFTVSDSSYRLYAATYHAPLDPSRLSFSLLSVAGLPLGSLTAAIESRDGLASVAIDSLTIGAAFLQGTGSAGQVFSISGSVQIPSDIAAQIFAGNSALIVLRDVNGSATLGLPSATLQQDMRVSWAGGGLSVGGSVSSVALRQAELAVLSDAGSLGSDGVMPDSGSQTPEPGSMGLAAFGGAMVIALWKRRVFRGPKPVG
jgi:hypothetical protein